MSLQFLNPGCGHWQTDDAPCNCRVRDSLHIEGDPFSWMDEPTHASERTAHEREWIAAMRRRHAEVTREGGTGEYAMWLEERLYALVVAS